MAPLKGESFWARAFRLCFLRLLRRNHKVVNRLAAGQEGDFSAGAGGGENFLGFLGLLLRDILAIEDGNKLGVLVGVRPGQTV